jgi:hypothetical protein
MMLSSDRARAGRVPVSNGGAAGVVAAGIAPRCFEIFARSA